MSKVELQTCSQSFVWVSLPECAIIFRLVASRTLFLCPVLYFCTNVVFHSVSEFCTHLCLAYHHNQIRGYHCILVIYYLLVFIAVIDSWLALICSAVYIVLQIRAGQQLITANLWPLTVNFYHVMIIVTSVFSKKSLLLLSFPRNSFEQSWTYFLVM